ncbi:MAG: DHA2 family efflux MFS transporter permease subunit [Sphingomonadales bacterium]|nr:DHA2 family efflux MFS transporter permease subunit [Sphingomonadales bacterium]
MTAPQADAPAYPDPLRRTLITLACLFSVMIVTLDGTIAVIALPRIQSSLGASQEQIAWVLTSYLVAQAVATPLSGWLADRFGRRRIMAASVLGFTFASLGCGASPNIEVLVLFRFLQGFFGASLVPLSQVLLLAINPPEKHGSAIALFGLGTLLGPTIGPTLGAWLTESFSWRWIFLINLPIGTVGFVGLVAFLRDKLRADVRPFDMTGFLAVSIALTALQLLLDRGQLLDWFSATEIRIEAVVAGLAGWTALVHMLTAADPFLKPATFRDRNFLIGSLLSAMVGVLLVGVVPLMTSIMQQLLGYPVMLAGMLSLPRALANMVGVFLAGRLVTAFGPRRMILAGLVLIVTSIWTLTTLSLDARQMTFGLVAAAQGLGSGFLFLPLTLAVFSTLPSHLRNEASALFTLVRSLGGSIGLSVLQTMTIRDTAAAQARLVEAARPDNPVAQLRLPGLDWGLPDALVPLAGGIARQAAMLAYLHTFQALLLLALLVAPACLLIRNPRRAGDANLPPVVVHAD